MALGLYIKGLGFTTVLEALFEQLSVHYDIHWIGLAYLDEPVTGKYNIYPNNVQGGDMYGAYHGAELATRLQADYVLILNDVWMMKNYQQTLGVAGRTWKNVAYVPLDGEIVHAEDLGNMSFLDALVAYTERDEKQYKSAFNVLGSKGTPAVCHAFHGVDTTLFYPLDKTGKREARQAIFPQVDADTVIILNANRYNVRKNHQATLDGFAKALKQTDQTMILCLHCPGIAEPHLNTLQSAIASLHLQDAVVINPLGDTHIPVERLNTLYNACDIGVNTSFGEGWGLISFEHAATGAAQIVPAHSAPGSIWKDHALLLPATEAIMIPGNPFRMYQVSNQELGHHLASLANDRGHLALYQRQAFRHSQDPRFRWSEIAVQWQTILESL